jgi:serine/threonine protein kinase/tetratricopeptide (TPR) repeat protein
VLAGRYRIDWFAARGGMGEVYRAVDIELGVPLALKTIRPEVASDPSFLRRFKQEVLLARSVSHPNVCRIYDLGRDETTGVTFLTMEYLAGETLASRIRTRGPIAADDALPIVRQLTDALEAAHRAGIIHRDFKSLNIMLVNGKSGERAVITDFGLAMAFGVSETARVIDRTSAPDSSSAISPSDADPVTAVVGTDSTVGMETHAGRVAGTPAYMSPEQLTGGTVGPASDLYSLGVVLYEMATGRLPFPGPGPADLARGRVTMEPPAPSLFAKVGPEWDRTILRLLSQEPEERYSSAREVVLALEGRVSDGEAARYSLPAECDAFVGRSSELAILARHLEGRPQTPDARLDLSHPFTVDPVSRLLTLQGLGGTGKTRLAQRYGWESLSRWPGGVWFCDLSEARTAEGIAVAVATALNVPLGRDDPIVQLGHAIAGHGRSLVILDNFEQVVEHAGTTLGKWLERARDTSFLVTTRERLRLPSEATLEVEPLDTTAHAVELFEVRAQSHRPGFLVDEANRDLVGEIVRTLDGLPLAIELAAARLRTLSLNQLCDRLVDRFGILAGGIRGRHATLRTALDWSWDLLLPCEQSAIAQASVFDGGFTLEAAEAVIDLSEDHTAPPVLDVMQALVDKSWLRARVAFETPRFEMYPTVREYASERLRPDGTRAGFPHAAPSRQAVEARHGSYYAGMGTDESIEMLDRPGGATRWAALQLELDNLVTACRQAVRRGNEETAAAAYRAAATVLGRRGPLRLSVDLGNDTLACLHKSALRASVLSTLALANELSGAMAEARAHYQEALVIYREIGDRRGEGAALSGLGTLHRKQGRMEEARVQFDAALAIHREVGNQRSEGCVLASLGLFHYHQGRMEEARSCLEAALAIFVEVGDRRSAYMAYFGLGNVSLDQGRTERARACFDEALAISRDVRDRRGEGAIICSLGNLDVEMGRMEEARARYEAALAIHRAVGDARFEGIVLGNLGIVDRDAGRVEMARRHFEAALRIHRGLGNRRLEGRVLGNLGVLNQTQGRMNEARADYEAGLALSREVGDRGGEGSVLGNLGSLALAQGRMEEARRYLDEGATIFREVGDRLELGRLLCVRGEYERLRSNLPASRSALAEATEIAEALCAPPASELAREIAELRRRLDDEDRAQ